MCVVVFVVLVFQFYLFVCVCGTCLSFAILKVYDHVGLRTYIYLRFCVCGYTDKSVYWLIKLIYVLLCKFYLCLFMSFFVFLFVYASVSCV